MSLVFRMNTFKLVHLYIDICVCLVQDPPSALLAPLHRAQLASTWAAAADRGLARAHCALHQVSVPHQASASWLQTTSLIQSPFTCRVESFQIHAAVIQIISTLEYRATRFKCSGDVAS